MKKEIKGDIRTTEEEENYEMDN